MKTEQLTSKTENEKNEFPILNGVFSPDEASEIILQLIHEKINFLKIRSLRQFIRYGTEDEWSLSRAEELKQHSEVIRELIRDAKNQGRTLNIQSNISIEFI